MMALVSGEGNFGATPGTVKLPPVPVDMPPVAGFSGCVTEGIPGIAGGGGLPVVDGGTGIPGSAGATGPV
jgi:hypothetical protein